jgi:hypothetical protein
MEGYWQRANSPLLPYLWARGININIIFMTKKFPGEEVYTNKCCVVE